MNERVTIKDVAREAGVSIKTVSNVLNNTGSMRPETRQRVEETIHRLGYTVNISARAMRGGGTRLIGLGIFDFSQPFAPYLADIVIDYARERQYGVIINTYGQGGGGLPSIIEDTYRLGADGWLFFTERPLLNEGAVLEQPYPVVAMGDYRTHGKADLVTMPNTEAVRHAVRRLVAGGCKRIAMLGAPTGWTRDAVMSADEGTQALRTQGFVEGLLSCGVDVDWRMIIPVMEWNLSGGVRAASELLDSDLNPDAIICLNDAMALGAMHELQRRGVRVPDDMQIIGFDNVPEARYAVPALTSVNPHVEEYAKKAVDMLIERIEGYRGPARNFVTDFSIEERASTRL
ncbi:LacI family DNA-binding transcriptional regulator [Bifidobacterium eulemuris]|uniref:LacI family DNA-binding transcriptional regulator n=1 Tax=Bifidobacterium eulemuris TaxID=1765219 RepID=A0A261G2K1_9BIFI|nr:LacI family DNA-binding transcriptional regulator [Bifidobacterium eulemuris]OZG65649.1 LacI family transcriptional regulator [Bifidobacterium eulemuris]QOL32417.1 LacI family DNA-binding transcriptional regulator [Bifidobacterium eulemuris]